jgi:hypothetical protein
VQSAILALLLVAGLAASTVWFVVVGASHARRTKVLARRANEMGMLFSVDDPFDIPRRYADFAIVSSGHSGRACNVTHGRIEGLPARAFDFHYELGHGTRRLRRCYGVVSLETGGQLPSLLLWQEPEATFAPLAVLQTDGRRGGWSFRGEAVLADIVLAADPAPPGLGACFETQGGTLILATPVRRRQDYAASLAALGRVFLAVKGAGLLEPHRRDVPAARASGKSHGASDARVETRPSP